VNFEDVPDCAILVLMALASGEPLGVHDGGLALRSDGKWLPVSDEVLTCLEERAWVRHDEQGVSVTTQGLWIIERWLVKRLGKRARGKAYRLSAARTA
jgi:hypothetical protein